MDVDTGSEERITYHEGFDGLPVFSPDGKRLMWTSSGRTADQQEPALHRRLHPGSRATPREAAASQ